MMGKHFRDERQKGREGNMGKDCKKNGDITDEGNDCPNQAHFCTFTNTYPVQDAQ